MPKINRKNGVWRGSWRGRDATSRSLLRVLAVLLRR